MDTSKVNKTQSQLWANNLLGKTVTQWINMKLKIVVSITKGDMGVHFERDLHSD